MAQLIILEGTRGVGKSLTAQALRRHLFGSTLINFTGFKEDNAVGYQKTMEYYAAFLRMFELLPSDALVVCDRIFISEVVYSALYKNYGEEFKKRYFPHALRELVSHNTVNLFYMTVSESKVIERVTGRDKALLFDSVGEKASEIMRQQEKYDEVFKWLEEYHSVLFESQRRNFHIHRIDTSNMTPAEVEQQIIANLQREGT